ncbi:MAG: NADPH-dependent FMN reductase [Verrucomicrobiaceae bacterium]
MKLLIIAATSHLESINLALASHAGRLVPGAELNILDLNDYEMPIYSEDREEATGIPEAAGRFIDAIQESDGVILSLAEHNGSYSAAFKNIYDWASRKEQKVWGGKPMLLMATSPGGRGGATVLAAGEATFPRMGAELVATFSLPSFYDSFSEEGISDAESREKFLAALGAFTNHLNNKNL